MDETVCKSLCTDELNMVRAAFEGEHARQGSEAKAADESR